MKYTYLKRQKGFTLVEMLISVSLFSVVMMIATSTIFGIIAGNRRSQDINAVVNNLNFAIESMVRDIKTGYSYQCGYSFPIERDDPRYLCRDASVAMDKIAFISTLSGTPEAVEYKFVPPNDTTPGYIEYTASNESSYPVTSPDVNVKSVKFYINNPGIVTPETDDEDIAQPGVFLVIEAETSDKNSKDKRVTKYNIQTFISQRHLNI